ncbi:hypothetical protein C9374_010448 [Naegleria lovaniensis]|uniref:Uncharacterized protein n=1 Tax=Naegleria lovaniensis TaxID=51637 RepID=A0AA88KFQ3_NAELO|nr:uncharacterized protein C9374_010448 [Naegleria lovaniensis]KAG2374704.1 hypothetical protein C9374_010448 [Naegleria lovaniensis]
MFPRRNRYSSNHDPPRSDNLFSLITEGPFRLSIHDNPLKNVRHLGGVMNIHSDRPSNPTQFACLPSELFGVILTFSGIQCLSLLSTLNRTSFEKFENEDDLVYKILLQTLMKKDEAHVEQVREKLGFTYKYSLKQLVRRCNRALGNGNYLFDTLHLSSGDEEEEYGEVANTTELETKCELCQVKIPEFEILSLTQCTVEMNVYIGKPSNGTLIKLGNESFTLSLEMEDSILKLVENCSTLLAHQYICFNEWTHIAIITSPSPYSSNYYSLRLLLNGIEMNVLDRCTAPSDVTRVDFLTCWQNQELKKPLIGKFTEVRVWNCSKQTNDITKNIQARLNPFVKSVNMDHLMLYFYPDLEDEDCETCVKNKSPLKDMKSLDNHLIISPNVKIRKIEARQPGFFDDLCNIL